MTQTKAGKQDRPPGVLEREATPDSRLALEGLA